MPSDFTYPRGCRVTVQTLNFGAVDGLSFAAAAGRLGSGRVSIRFTPRHLGPLLEILHLAAGGRMPSPVKGDWLALDGARALVQALGEERECWVSSGDRHTGFIRAIRGGPDGNSRWTAFLMDAQRAARNIARLPGTTPGQLVASMEELESNIHEHCSAAETGLVAFRGTPSLFEFVVADRGIGILKSLQSSADHATLSDHGKALELALTDGVSRYGNDVQRGYGFRPLFVGLVNLQSFLRFRSGDHALTMDGTNPNLAMAQLAQKADMDGFLASVSCGLGND